MKPLRKNPTIIQMEHGVKVIYEFAIQPIDYDGTFRGEKIGIHHRTLMYEFDSDYYSFLDSREDGDNEPASLLSFHVNEKELQNHEKYIAIDFGKTHFETVGHYVFNSFDRKASELGVASG